MCIAVLRKSNAVLSRETLKRCFEKNDDGAGFVFAHGRKLILEKGFFTFNKFWNAFSKVPKNCPAIIHFRIASSGLKNKKNCHPFLINQNCAMAHNGILHDWVGEEKDKKSDTVHFVEQILRPLLSKVPRAYLDILFQHMLEKTIDVGNKMIFLDANGRHSILREYAGEWDKKKGCWFSNDGYKNDKTVFLPDWEPSERVRKKKFTPRSEIERILGAPAQFDGRYNTNQYEKELNISHDEEILKLQQMLECGAVCSDDVRSMLK